MAEGKDYNCKFLKINLEIYRNSPHRTIGIVSVDERFHGLDDISTVSLQ